MIKQVQLFLGPARIRVLILLLTITGLLSLILNGFNEEWVPAVQTLLLVAFLVGSAVVVGGRMQPQERLRWVAILAPSLGAVVLGFTVLPQFLLPLLGAGAGWIIAGAFLFRQRVPKEYQDAIKHLRKGEYEASVKAMDTLIKADPTNENYYRFRAEVFRIWGKLNRSREDYQTMIEIAPESAVAYNGLAEVYLQSDKFTEAQTAALQAYELAPDEWVAAYNLGMIEDRLREAESAVMHLQHALEIKVPDARHRLLIYFYLARAHVRLGDMEAAQAAVENMKRQKSGLEEWQSLLQHEEAAALKKVLEQDVAQAQALVDGKTDVSTLA